jgi:hypothetical protein
VVFAEEVGCSKRIVKTGTKFNPKGFLSYSKPTRDFSYITIR